MPDCEDFENVEEEEDTGCEPTLVGKAVGGVLLCLFLSIFAFFFFFGTFELAPLFVLVTGVIFLGFSGYGLIWLCRHIRWR